MSKNTQTSKAPEAASVAAPQDPPASPAKAPMKQNRGAWIDRLKKWGKNGRRKFQISNFKFQIPRKEEPKKSVTDAVPPADKDAKKDESDEKHESFSTAIVRTINNIGLGKDRIVFIRNLSTLINTGTPLDVALESQIVEIRGKRMRRAIKRMVESVRAGKTLWQAMEKQRLFTPYELALIRIGEESRDMAKAMRALPPALPPVRRPERSAAQIPEGRPLEQIAVPEPESPAETPALLAEIPLEAPTDVSEAPVDVPPEPPPTVPEGASLPQAAEPAKTEGEPDGEKPVAEEEKAAKGWSMFGGKAGQKKPPKKKSVQVGGFSAFLKSINNIGMGKYRTSFVQNLSTMLNAGLPLIEALETQSLEVKAKPMKKAIKRIAESVQAGSTLWRSMEDQYLFTPYELALIRIGEEAGNLARNMEYLSEQQEKDRSLRQKVKMAMIYPAIVIVLMFIIVMALGLFVLPNLIQVLFSLNVELPLSTRLLIWFTKTFNENAAVVLPLCFTFMIMIYLLTKYTRFKRVTQAVIFRIPGVGRLVREATIARFGVVLGGLLRAGVPLTDALHSLVSVTQIVAYQHYYAKLTENIEVGDSFSKCFQQIRGSKKLLPISVQQLIATGERSGALSDVLLKIADIYDKKASETAEKLPVVLEPILLLTIGGLVAGIAFSIIVPIYSVVGNVGR